MAGVVLIDHAGGVIHLRGIGGRRATALTVAEASALTVYEFDEYEPLQGLVVAMATVEIVADFRQREALPAEAAA